MSKQDLYDIAFDILCGIFGEDPDTEVVWEVVSYADTDLDEMQATQNVYDICERMFG